MNDIYFIFTTVVTIIGIVYVTTVLALFVYWLRTLKDIQSILIQIILATIIVNGFYALGLDEPLEEVVSLYKGNLEVADRLMMITKFDEYISLGAYLVFTTYIFPIIGIVLGETKSTTDSREEDENEVVIM